MKRRFGSFFYQRQSASHNAPPERAQSSGWFGNILRKACIVVGAVVLFSFTMGILSALFFGGKSSGSLPDDMILVMNLSEPVSETELGRTLADPFSSSGMTIRSFVETLDRAGRDERTRGLLLNLDTGAMELAHIQEIRGAIKRFRSAGKFAHIYTASFADLRSGIGAYYLASAFDEIWVQPTGFISITGLSIEMPFAKEVLNKLGANPEFLHREEYKSAMESFTRASISPENREMLESIMAEFSAQIFADIAMDRAIENDLLKAQIDRGLITGEDAVKASLITKVGYADELVDSVRQKIGGDVDADEPPLVVLEDYADVMLDDRQPSDGEVALVHVSGQIVPGSKPEPGFASGDYIASAIMDAADMESVKVIVVRVDSPGGSPSASETIRRAIVSAKADGKKVIVSMGPVAASGGYWVSVNADKIYAMPTTLTGSVGVIMGKFELSGLWDKVGVNWDSVRWGKNAGLWSPNEPLTAQGRAALETAIDSTYAAFIGRVAEGRKMKPEDVRKIAKGRAWTGTQARANGLIDELGGLDSAMDEAAKMAEVTDRAKLRVIQLPEPLSPFEQIMELMGNQVSVTTAIPFLKTAAPELKALSAFERMGPVQTYAIMPRVRP